MPELPEVETTLRGIHPFVMNAELSDVTVRNPSLRWPIPVIALESLVGQRITRVSRRAKYILLGFDSATVILHLGMSGSLRVLDKGHAPKKHDHVDLLLSDKKILRFNDPRRFGCLLLTHDAPEEHKLLSHLGPEPLHDSFDAEYLFKQSRKRNVPVKNFIMQGQVVVGVGNIYASEALFMAGVRPMRVACKVTQQEYSKLVDTIKFVLQRSIDMGGTTLRDFTRVDGQAGYFKQKLQVYDRLDKPCRECDALVKKIVIGQRSSFYCPKCQR